jgi:hypothetical protein
MESNVIGTIVAVVRVPRVRYSDPVLLIPIGAHGVGVPNPWHPAPGLDPHGWRVS